MSPENTRWFRVEQMSVLESRGDGSAVVIYRVDQKDPDYCPYGKVRMQLFSDAVQADVNRFFANAWAKMHFYSGLRFRVGCVKGLITREWKQPKMILVTERNELGLSWVREVIR